MRGNREDRKSLLLVQPREVGDGRERLRCKGRQQGVGDLKPIIDSPCTRISLKKLGGLRSGFQNVSCLNGCGVLGHRF